MIKRFFLILSFTLIAASLIQSQNFIVKKIEPPNWWVKMKLNKIQLMVYGKNLSNVSVNFQNKAIKVLKIHNAQSPDYLFVDIEIPANLPVNDYKLDFHKGQFSTSYSFPLLKKPSDKGRFQGFNNSDVIYLIMPDRFSDGDTANNNFTGMPDKCNIRNPIDRHGGDIQGIINHLPYLKELGVTTIWITPLIENNTEKHLYAYAGYSATDLYKIDPRFGTLNLYKKLIDDAHKLGLKVILDHVSNHISISHPWIKDLPFPDWINGTVKNHIATNHDKLAFADIHRDSSTIKINTEGWFTNYLPDLNQGNPFLEKYLVENTIWWVESSGVDGIREDTYPYCNQNYLADWAKKILNEFPNLNIVGEVWTGDAVFLSTFQKNNYFPGQHNTNLPAITDFALYDNLTAFIKNQSGLYNIYKDFAEDFLFPDPNNLVTFIDNHDVMRALLQAKGDVKKFKMALAILLTSRGIPSLLYGTEVGIEGGPSNDLARADFPGGFPGDSLNAFSESGRTKFQNNIYDYVHKLLLLRKEYKALSQGQMVHFPPVNEIYTYFKSFKNEKFMIIINNNKEPKDLNLNLYQDQINGFSKIKNSFTNEITNLNTNSPVKLSSESSNIFQLLK